MRSPDVLSGEGREILVQPGDAKDLVFRAPAPGTYAMTCADHDWAGMWGRSSWSEPASATWFRHPIFVRTNAAVPVTALVTIRTQNLESFGIAVTLEPLEEANRDPNLPAMARAIVIDVVDREEHCLANFSASAAISAIGQDRLVSHAIILPEPKRALTSMLNERLGARDESLVVPPPASRVFANPSP